MPSILLLTFGVLVMFITFPNEASPLNKDTAPPTPSSSTPSNDQDDRMVLETLSILEKGELEIELLANETDLILVVGTTGVGKTTMTQFLTQDTSDLVSYRDKGVRYLIKDTGGKIGTRTTVSKSIFPERVLNIQDPTQVFYDCPGFSDTRSSSVEIANAFFIKKVTDHAQRLKILLVIHYQAVTADGIRDGFNDLITHTLNFFKSVDRFHNSMLLLVTKVNEPADTNQHDIVEGIADFLEKAQQDLPQNGWTGSRLQLATNLIDALLQKDENGNYTKIGIFRQPRQPGFLSSIPEVQQCKLDLEMKIRNNIIYTNSSPSDFSYTLTDKSVRQIGKLVRGCNAKITGLVQNIFNQEKSNLLESQKSWNSTSFQKRRNALSDQRRILETMRTSVKSVEQFLTILKESFISPDNSAEKGSMSSPVENMIDQIKQQGMFLDFLEKAVTDPIQQNFLGWLDPIQTFIFESSFILGDPIDLELLKEGLTASFRAKYLVLSEIFLKTLPPQTHTVLLEALDTIFIDVDFTRTLLKLSSQVNVSIIAPRWVIQGQRKINLDGYQGKNHDPPRASQDISGNGFPGNPGHPGENGGNFLAMGLTFEKRSPDGLCNLIVTVNGGKGGKGQDGGNGLNGTDGETAHLRDIQHKAWSPIFWSESWTKIVLSPHFPKYEKDGPTHAYSSWGVSNYEQKYKFFGLPGQRGKNGGDGGQGGIGGQPGKVHIIFPNSGLSTSKSHPMELDNKNGSTGEGGMSGSGGIGGKDGQDRTAEFVVTKGIDRAYKFQDSLGSYDFFDRYGLTGGEGRAEDGTQGLAGSNRENMIQPPMPHSLLVTWCVTTFKMNGLEFLGKTVTSRVVHVNSTFFTSFLQFMNSEKRMTTFDDLPSLYDEFTRLETISPRLVAQKLDLFSVYHDLLQRIVRVAPSTPKGHKSAIENLLYLYTAVYSRFCSLRSSHLIGDSNLVVDLEKYFNLAKEQIQSLREIRKAENGVKATESMRQKYVEDIQKKSEEASNFIEKVLLPQIAKDENQVNKNIDTLLEEIKTKRQSAINATIDLIQQEKELSRLAAMRTFFSVFKVLGQGLSFLGPKGAAAGALIGSVTSITESFVLDDNTGQQKPLTLPVTIRQSIDRISVSVVNQKTREAELFNQQLRDVSKQLEDLPELEPTKTKVDTLRSMISDLSSSPQPLTLQDFESLEQGKVDLKTALKDQEKALKSEKEKAAGNIERNQRIVSRLVNVRHTLDVAVDIYSRHRMDSAKLDALTKEIEDGKTAMAKLEEFGKQVEQTMKPMVQNFHNTLTKFEGTVKDQSSVGLDLSRWKVQTLLRKMKRAVREFTRDMNVEETMSSTVGELEEAMTTLIGLYDRIQGFQEQAQLANYIAATQTLHFVDDPMIHKLQVVIQSNRVRLIAQTALHTFKIWAFPFAQLHLQALPPLQLDPFNQNFTANDKDTEMGRFANRTCDQIDLMRTALLTAKSTIPKYNRYIKRGVQFKSGRTTSPFFVWKDGEFDGLLTGQNVTVMADIRKSPTGRDAIKANRIEIKLKVVDVGGSRNNGSAGSSAQAHVDGQAELNEVLKDFSVDLDHMGNSYYRYKGEYYGIRSESLHINYHFERKGPSSSEPLEANLVYDKLKSGDLSLSPYTFWRIQLQPLVSETSGGNGAFGVLEPFQGRIQLELVGEGSYLMSGGPTAAELSLDTFYETIV